MDYLEASAFYPHLSALDKIKYYAIFGGIPQILSHIDESKGIEWNILSQFMKEGGAARCYIGLVFDRELSPLKRYRLPIDGNILTGNPEEGVVTVLSYDDEKMYCYDLSEWL